MGTNGLSPSSSYDSFSPIGEFLCLLCHSTFPIHSFIHDFSSSQGSNRSLKDNFINCRLFSCMLLLMCVISFMAMLSAVSLGRLNLGLDVRCSIFGSKILRWNILRPNIFASKILRWNILQPNILRSTSLTEKLRLWKTKVLKSEAKALKGQFVLQSPGVPSFLLDVPYKSWEWSLEKVTKTASKLDLLSPLFQSFFSWTVHRE